MTDTGGDGALYFPTVGRFRQWLRKNHARDGGAWIMLSKKGTGAGIAYEAALEEALCWGWIDGKVHRRDEHYFVQWFSPRRPQSAWSLANRRRVDRLQREGRMQPPGLARVAEARRDGRWAAAYASAAPPRMSADVRRALRSAGAGAPWGKTSPSRKLMLLSWVNDAKRPETRARRLAELPTLVKEGRLAGFAAP
jgi:uncharacterized protein YdeI (YjbR/CyaY-like superfamily)